MKTDQWLELTLRIESSASIDSVELDRMRRQLWGELREIRVDSLERIAGEPTPDGARTLGSDLVVTFAVKIAAEGVYRLILLLHKKLKQWRERIGKDIEIAVEVGGHRVNIRSDMTDQERNAVAKKLKRFKQTKPFKRQRYALLIGNSDYDHLPKLKKPAQDVKGLAEVLTNPEIGGFEAKTIMDEPWSVVQKEIARFYANRERDDLLLLYFAGHGVKDSNGRLYLTARDTEQDNLHGTAIPARFIRERIMDSLSNRKITLLDCCHSGAFSGAMRGFKGSSFGINDVFKDSGYGSVVLTATDEVQYSWEEWEKGTKGASEFEHSVFTHFLIEGLSTGQADRDQDGKVEVNELYHYVSSQVRKVSRKQNPRMIIPMGLDGEMFVARNPYPQTLPQPKKRKIPWVPILILFNIVLFAVVIFVLFSRAPSSDSDAAASGVGVLADTLDTSSSPLPTGEPSLEDSAHALYKTFLQTHEDTYIATLDPNFSQREYIVNKPGLKRDEMYENRTGILFLGDRVIVSDTVRTPSPEEGATGEDDILWGNITTQRARREGANISNKGYIKKERHLKHITEILPDSLGAAVTVYRAVKEIFLCDKQDETNKNKRNDSCSRSLKQGELFIELISNKQEDNLPNTIRLLWSLENDEHVGWADLGWTSLPEPISFKLGN